MANTYTQIHIQAVFAVRNRDSVIRKAWKNDLCKYITGIITHYEHKLLQIECMPDHVHVFYGMRPHQSISDLLKEVKGSSSRWINKNRLARGHFSWQEGFGAFSYSRDQVDQVINYIKTQEVHHRKINFTEEYLKFLKEFEIEFDEQYTFIPIQFDESDL